VEPKHGLESPYCWLCLGTTELHQKTTPDFLKDYKCWKRSTSFFDCTAHGSHWLLYIFPCWFSTNFGLGMLMFILCGKIFLHSWWCFSIVAVIYSHSLCLSPLVSLILLKITYSSMFTECLTKYLTKRLILQKNKNKNNFLVIVFFSLLDFINFCR